MKWYDHVVCIACAWHITQGMFGPDWWRIFIGWGLYTWWLWYREWEVKNGEE